MSDIMKLLDEISDREREINDYAKEHRLKIVSDLIQYACAPYGGSTEGGLDIDGLIKDAGKLSRFVERGPVGDHISDRVFDGTRHINPKKVKKLSENHSRTHGKPKAKRPYVKRSKFWKKK